MSCKVRCKEDNKVFNSVKDAGLHYGICRKSITACCREKYKTSGGLHFEYYEEPDLPGEIWKDAKCITEGKLYDFTGRYLISNKGRIKKLENKQVTFGNTSGTSDYLSIKIDDTHHLIHRIVATTFIQNDDPENKIHVNHINEEEKTNNCVENLEWCTPTYNVNYGTRTERAAKSSELSVKCTVTGEIFTSIKEAAKHYKIQAGNISRCCKKDRNYCGKLPDGTKLTWEYYDEDSE